MLKTDSESNIYIYIYIYIYTFIWLYTRISCNVTSSASNQFTCNLPINQEPFYSSFQPLSLLKVTIAFHFTFLGKISVLKTEYNKSYPTHEVRSKYIRRHQMLLFHLCTAVHTQTSVLGPSYSLPSKSSGAA
jgi:hypothetical protein